MGNATRRLLRNLNNHFRDMRRDGFDLGIRSSVGVANLPIAVIEEGDNKHSVGSGMQQALGYADALDVPFVFSSNGDGFLFHAPMHSRTLG